MTTFTFKSIEHQEDDWNRALVLNLLSIDLLTGMTFSSSAFAVQYECSVWNKNATIWEKKVALNLENQGTLGTTRRDDYTGLRQLIDACLPDLILSGYVPTGSYDFQGEIFQINPHDVPIEAFQLPPDL